MRTGIVSAAMLRRTVSACRTRYGRHPNVIGIGYGLKFRRGLRRSEGTCIHFYVRRKPRKIERGRLPAFVLGRRRSGVDRRVRIATDVIALRNLGFACRSGTQIDVPGELGAITLLFRNKAPGSSDFYLVTCAHVAGDVTTSPPVAPEVRSACCGHPVLARTLFNTTAVGGQVEYDAAIAALRPECTPQPDLAVMGSGARLTRFRPTDEIQPGDTLSCAFPVSNLSSTVVSSGPVALPLRLDGIEYDVHNLHQIDGSPLPGDSGGLLFDGQEAVGILVARSDGFGFFQPLGDAFDHLREQLPIDVRCFSP